MKTNWPRPVVPSPLVNPPPLGSGIDPNHSAREALAMTVDSMLSRQSCYAIVTYDTRGKLVIFACDEYDRPKGTSPDYDVHPLLFKADLNNIGHMRSNSMRGAVLFPTSVKEAEKRRTAVIKYLNSIIGTDEEFCRDDASFYLRDKRCAELVTIVRLGHAVTTLHPVVKKRKASKDTDVRPQATLTSLGQQRLILSIIGREFKDFLGTNKMVRDFLTGKTSLSHMFAQFYAGVSCDSRVHELGEKLDDALEERFDLSEEALHLNLRELGSLNIEGLMKACTKQIQHAINVRLEIE